MHSDSRLAPQNGDALRPAQILFARAVRHPPRVSDFVTVAAAA